jgi:hypothetical protein
MAGLLEEQLLAMMIADSKNGIDRMKLVIACKITASILVSQRRCFIYTFFQ